MYYPTTKISLVKHWTTNIYRNNDIKSLLAKSQNGKTSNIDLNRLFAQMPVLAAWSRGRISAGVNGVCLRFKVLVRYSYVSVILQAD